VIKSFKDKETEKIYNREGSNKLPRDIQQIALRKLRMLNNVKSLNDLRVPPANRLEKMKGNREGQLSIRINDQWRICFKWRSGDVHEVEITDYH
jgi:proteic killer suppression protein